MYNVKLYSQTGYDAVNIPDSIETLKSLFSPTKEYNNINVNQSQYQATLRVDNITPSQAARVDYVIIEGGLYDKAAYTVDSYNMVAPDVVEFILAMDAYNTLGGFGPTSGNMIIGGTANRMHISVADDNANFYTLAEPFQPSEKEEGIIQQVGPQPDILNDKRVFIGVTALPPCKCPVMYSNQDILGAKIEGVLNSKDNAMSSEKVAISKAIGQGVIKTTVKIDDTNITSYDVKMQTIPASRRVDVFSTTTIYVTKLDGEETLDEQTMKIFDSFQIDSETKDNLLDDLIAYDMTDALVAIWVVPICFVHITILGKYSTASEIIGEVVQPAFEAEPMFMGLEAIKPIYSAGALTVSSITSYNNKVKYGQSRCIIAYNMASGDLTKKQVYDIVAPGSTPLAPQMPFAVTADVRPTGSTIFAWGFIKGANNLSNPIEYIKGSNWQQIAIRGNGVLGSYMQSMRNTMNAAYEQSIQQAQLELAGHSNSYIKSTNVATNIGANVNVGANYDMGGNFIKAHQQAGISASGNASIGTNLNFAESNYKSYDRLTPLRMQLAKSASMAKYVQQEAMLDRQATFAGATFGTNNSDYARDAYSNTFRVAEYKYSVNDLNAFDTFLTQYGYNVGNKPITNADFYSRPSYNFVRINDIEVESVNASSAIIELCKAQLKVGLRIWHKKPNPQDMLASGNR